MDGAARILASAAFGSLLVVGSPEFARAQAERTPVPPVSRPAASFAPGSISGVVQDETGAPIAGVVISALGPSTTIAVSDKTGRFEFQHLVPGPYMVRAHLSGYVAPRPRTVQVSPNAMVVSPLALRRAGSQLLAAGFGGATDPSEPAAPPPAAQAAPDQAAAGDHTETSWHIRHARRSVLKDVVVPVEWLAVDAPPAGGLGAIDFLSRAVESPARAASSFFADTPFSGQVNLLTTGSFDSPQQLFSSDTLSRNVAYLRVGAPVGDQGDWTVRGALTQADLSSWIVAGSYTSRVGADRHRYDLGMSYGTQRYDGGNVLALHDVSDGSRNAGTVYAFDSMAVTPAVTLSYGASYSRYDYLNARNLLNPRAEVTVAPAPGTRLTASVARRALAPGAEEFLPPGDSGLSLPPQRTFSSLVADQPFRAERTTHGEVGIEHDFGATTVEAHAFRQHVDDQLVTIFDAEIPGRPVSKLGHYVVADGGDVDAQGCRAAVHTVIAKRIRGSVEYTIASAQTNRSGDLRYLLLVAPAAVRPTSERVQDLQTSIEAEMPETATRVVVLYRISDAFANQTGAAGGSRSPLDGRFDVQVRQSLPFMNFSNARWEMLVAVRNFFHESGSEQSLYDELLVVRPPKRVVGGVTLHF